MPSRQPIALIEDPARWPPAPFFLPSRAPSWPSASRPWAASSCARRPAELEQRGLVRRSATAARRRGRPADPALPLSGVRSSASCRATKNACASARRPACSSSPSSPPLPPSAPRPKASACSRLTALRLATRPTSPAPPRSTSPFHDAIADLAGNKVLAVMLRSVAQLGRLSREVTLKRFGVARAHGSPTSAFSPRSPPPIPPRRARP